MNRRQLALALATVSIAILLFAGGYSALPVAPRQESSRVSTDTCQFSCGVVQFNESGLAAGSTWFANLTCHSTHVSHYHLRGTGNLSTHLFFNGYCSFTIQSHGYTKAQISPNHGDGTFTYTGASKISRHVTFT